MAAQNPIRVLHSVGSLRRGGIETWLLNVLRQRHPDLHMDFLLAVPPGTSGDYEREAIAAGSNLFYRPCVSWLSKRLRMAGLVRQDRTLEKTLRAGNYDVLHVHGDEFNGDTMKAAARAGAPVRVAHCHHTRVARGKGGPEMWIRRLRYFTLDRARTLRHATDLVACGRDAGHLMVGDRWNSDDRCQVIYCGVILGAFERAISDSSREKLLARHSLPPDAKVFGHAGSMGPGIVKNHGFLVRAFAECARRDSRYHLFMAGDGSLRREIEAQVQSLGIVDRVRMPGVVANVPELMTHLFDAHILPSLAEGLPVVCIEAAAAGLHSLISDTITTELCEHLPGRISRLSLHAPLATWADKMEQALSQRESPADGVRRVRDTPLSIERSTAALVDLYRARLNGL